MNKFKVGDRVKYVKGRGNNPIGLIIGTNGTVIGLENKCVSVEYDFKIGGHSNCGKGKESQCWDMLSSELELLCEDNYKTIKIKEVLYGTKTTIIKWSDGTQTEAVCAPDDNFDKQVGFAIAYTRKMNGGKLSE